MIHPSILNDRFQTGKNRTPEYEAAVAALKALPDMVAVRAYAEAEAMKVLISQAEGLKWSKAGSPHPYRLIGKRPPWHVPLPPGSDHSTLWNKDGKAHLWTTQPYSLDADAITAYARMIEAGYHIHITTHSWWFPGSTLMVEVEYGK